MAIFSNKAFTPVEEEYNEIEYPNIMPTIESAYEIACEGYCDIHKLVAGMYVSDILIESAVCEGAEAEPLVESAVSDFAKKAVEKFKEIRGKIIDWFKKIIDNLKIKFTSTSKFVSTYKTRINDSIDTIKTFETPKHNFNTDVRGVVSGAMNAIVDFAKADSEKKSAKANDDFVSRMVKKVDSKANTISEMKASVVKTLVGDEVPKGHVNASDIKKMIDYCENMSVRLASLEDLKNVNVKKINDIIKDLDGSGKDVDVIHAKVKNYNAAVSAVQQLNTVAVSVVNQINKEYIAIMRALMTFKPAKENFVADEELMKENTNSIFESALNMI